MIEIPLAAVPAQSLRIVLGDQNCTIALRQKDNRMYMDLDVGQDRIFTGAICMDRVNIKQFVTMAFSGGLYFVDTIAQDPPQFEGLGQRWGLLYFEEGEI